MGAYLLLLKLCYADMLNLFREPVVGPFEPIPRIIVDSTRTAHAIWFGSRLTAEFHTWLLLARAAVERDIMYLTSPSGLAWRRYPKGQANDSGSRSITCRISESFLWARAGLGRRTLSAFNYQKNLFHLICLLKSKDRLDGLLLVALYRATIFFRSVLLPS